MLCSKGCGAALNPYVQADFSAAKLWICPFCHARNHFPPHYEASALAYVLSSVAAACASQPDRPSRLRSIAAACLALTACPQPVVQGMSEQNLPAELFPNLSTIEYTLPAMAPPQPPAYVFVVDTALTEDELGACRAALSQALQIIPEYAQVSLCPVTAGI